MTVTINGTTGIAGVDGSASTPSVQGADTNTGMFFPAADTIAFAEGGVEVMRIDSSGNVGIGTSSPATYGKLAVAGSILNVPDTSSVIAIGRFSSGYGGAALSTVGSATFMSLQLEGVERARIDASGNLLVGTTGVINSSNAIAQFLNVNGGRPGINVGNSVGSSATNCVIFTNSNGTVGSIQTSGTSTSYVTSSDYRLKHDVEPMTTGLATVSSLKPVTYKWNADDSDGEGFIAHELQSVIPHAVTGERDAVDEDGKPIHQGVDYSKIVVHLVAAIQELKAQNDELKARLEALEAK